MSIKRFATISIFRTALIFRASLIFRVRLIFRAVPIFLPAALILVAALISLASGRGFCQDSLTLWYKAPAKAWTEALPLGNGRLGAMVFGGVGQELIQLNESSLWTG